MLNEVYAETLFNFLYGTTDGYIVSNFARRNLAPEADKFLYGEIPFKTWKKIIEQINPQRNGVFFDLGSGTGRVVMQSYLLSSFNKTIGIELLEGLHNKACEIQKVFEKLVKPRILKHVENRELLFLNKNIFAIDLHEADLILLNYPLKGEENFLKLEEKFLKELKPGTKIVSTIRPLANKAFKSIGIKMHKFSWGKSSTYLYEV